MLVPTSLTGRRTRSARCSSWSSEQDESVDGGKPSLDSDVVHAAAALCVFWLAGVLLGFPGTVVMQRKGRTRLVMVR